MPDSRMVSMGVLSDDFATVDLREDYANLSLPKEAEDYANLSLPKEAKFKR